MAEALQVEQNVSVAADAPGPDEPRLATYGVVPSNAPKPDDLYGFREAMVAQQAEAEKAKEKSRPNPVPFILGALTVAGLAAAAIFLLFFSPHKVVGPKPPVLYIDLGTQRFEQAGVGARLIARWENSASFQLFVDPLDADQMARFQAVAQDPPHTISFNVRLLDITGAVACQKEILIPPMNGSGAAPDHAQALQPRTTASGDTVQNMADRDGQITEIDVAGSLPCSADAYRSIKSWDFSTNFPTIDDQDEWLRHENTLTGKAKPKPNSAGYGMYSLVRSLPAPIEGDDVIVSDNPSRGIVATSEGRIFLVGASVLTDRALDWQSFPASVHFHCEKTAVCTVTRLNSRTAVRARMLR